MIELCGKLDELNIDLDAWYFVFFTLKTFSFSSSDENNFPFYKKKL